MVSVQDPLISSMVRQVDRLLFLIGQGLIAAINAYTCLTYMESGVFACYRKTMTYDERKNACAQFVEMMKKEANMRGSFYQVVCLCHTT